MLVIGMTLERRGDKKRERKKKRLDQEGGRQKDILVTKGKQVRNREREREREIERERDRKRERESEKEREKD